MLHRRPDPNGGGEEAEEDPQGENSQKIKCLI